MPAKKKEPEVLEQPSLKRVIAEINRKYGANTIGTLTDMISVQMPRVSTGVEQLDQALGGGFPLGRMVELFGTPSSGKSLISLLTIAQAQKQGLDCVYIDAENSLDLQHAEKLGVDISKLQVLQTSTAETIIDLMAKILQAQPGVIVLDSVASMITQAELEEDMDQQFMAIKARVLGRGLAKLNALNKKTLIIFINQLRSTMAMYGDPTTTPGGRALGHFVSIRLKVHQPSEKLTADGKKTSQPIGQIVQYVVKKNKTAPPYKDGTFKFWYDYHIE